MFKRYAILEDEAPPDGGAGGGAGGDGAPPAGGGGDGTPPATPPPAAPRSALGAGADFVGDPPPPAGGGDGGGTGDPPPAPAVRPDWCPAENWNAEAGAPVVPEKFWNKETNQPNTAELAKSYAGLEKRFKGATDLPPKEPSEYKFELRDGEDLTVDPALEAPFKERAHKMGLNNAQYNEILRDYADGYVEAGRAAVQGYIDHQAVDTIAKLKAEHGSDAAVQQIQGAAYRAFMRWATPDEQKLINELPDHPALVNVLARIGNAIKEDGPPNAGGSDTFVSLTQQADALYKDLAGPYWNANHPQHASAMATHNAYMAECQRRGVDPLKNRLPKSA